jgi:hypothetical protein
VNLLVIDTAIIHGLSDGTRLVGLLLEDLEKGQTRAEAALRSSIVGHHERVDEVVRGCLRLVKCGES